MNRCTVLNKKLVFDFPLTDGDYFFYFHCDDCFFLFQAEQMKYVEKRLRDIVEQTKKTMLMQYIFQRTDMVSVKNNQFPIYDFMEHMMHHSEYDVEDLGFGFRIFQKETNRGEELLRVFLNHKTEA
ncbi:MAG: hypothetical protein J6K51_05945 [Clostridia bacterium]|nr:hypothetical protein [Clostridia bacterium]